jgi:arylsulfatase A-like enzyme
LFCNFIGSRQNHCPIFNIMKNQSVIILVACLGIFALLSCSSRHKVKDNRPNIILICADDMGWSDLGCYGSEIQTPNLDRLAGEGMRFTSFYNTSKCFPSRACLLTGVYAQQCGYHLSYKNPIRNAVTLGEVLRDAGYRTLFSGKHHGLENPYYRGFDRYYGLKEGACNHFNPGLQREGEPVPANKGRPRPWCFDSLMLTPYTPEEKDFYTTDYFTKYAIGWLEEYRDESRPFFLYLAYTAPHDPLMAWPEDIQRYRGKYDSGYGEIRKQRYEKQLEMGLIDSSFRLSEPTYRPWAELSDDLRREEAGKMEVYAAMIDRLDRNIGQLLKTLEATGKSRNTLIMFVSDNGASAEVVRLDTDDDDAEMGSMARWVSLGRDWANVSNTPFRFYKNNSFEGGINTPMIAYWPGRIKSGCISRFPGHFIDFMPTLVEIAGASYPESHMGEPVTPMQGQSLLPVFEGLKTKRTGPLFWAWSEGQAMRKENWKIVKLVPEQDWELYNLAQDQSETVNLAPENPVLLSEFDSLYQTWHSTYY